MIIDAALTPADIAALPQRNLENATCIVFDVLRATSSMVTALAHGVSEIHPACSIEEALEMRSRMPDAVLGGERHGDPIQGFDVGNSPLEYKDFFGRRVITTTTNGTVALRACEKARRVLVGALLNLNALRKAVIGDEEILLVCAGTFETFALEDAIAAGALAGLFPSASLTDATRACVATARAFSTPMEALLAARNGKALDARGWREQIEWCSQVSRFGMVGAMSSGIIRPL